MVGPGTRSALILVGVLALAASARAAQDAPDVARGAKAWAENCARCHNMRGAEEFPDDLWKPIVTHMRVRGGLTGQEARDILEFLRRSN